MTGDIPEAALRLLTQLPVRTHEQVEKTKKRYTWSPRAFEAKGKRILHRGKYYRSHVEAMAKMRVGKIRLMRMIDSGLAVYVE